MHCTVSETQPLLAFASVFIAVYRNTWFRRQQYLVLVTYRCLPVHSTIIESMEHVSLLSCLFPS